MGTSFSSISGIIKNGAGVAGNVLQSISGLATGGTDAILKLLISLFSSGQIILGVILSCMLSFLSALMVGDDLGFSVNSLREVFFGTTLYDSLCDSANFLAAALLIVFFFFVTLKTSFSSITGNQDTLKNVFLRVTIAVALLLVIRPTICYVMDNFVNVLWEGNGSDVDGVKNILIKVDVGEISSGGLNSLSSRAEDIADAMSSNPSLADLSIDTVKLLCTSASKIIVFILAIIIIVMFVKLLIEAYARYLSMVMVIIFSPTACVGFISVGTSQIFTKYMRMIFTQVSVMFLTKMWMQITGTISLSGDSMDIGTYVIIIAWVAAGLKLESYFRAVGLDVVQQGFGLANQMTMALFTAQQMGRAGNSLTSGAVMAGAAATGNMSMGKAASFLAGKSTESADVLKAMQQSPFARSSYNGNTKESISNAMQNPSREGYNAVHKLLSNLNAPDRQQALSDMANGLYGNALSHIKGMKENGGGALSNMSFTDNGTLQGNIALGNGMGSAKVTISDKPIASKENDGLNFSFQDANGYEKYAHIEGNGDFDPEKLSEATFIPDIAQTDSATTQEIAANSFAKDWNLDESDVNDREFAFNFDERGNVESVESRAIDSGVSIKGSDDQPASSDGQVVGRYGDRGDYTKYDATTPSAEWFSENGKFENLGLHEVSSFTMPQGTQNLYVGTAKTESGLKVQLEMRQHGDGTKLESGWRTYQASDGTKWDLKATRSSKNDNKK